MADCRHDAFDPHYKEDREEAEAEDKNVEESENFLDMAVSDEDVVALNHASVFVEIVDFDGNYFAILFDCCYSYYN